MSVLACNKNGCENVMCDVYIHPIGYLCNECIVDFKTYVELEELGRLADCDIDDDLEAIIDNIPNKKYSERALIVIARKFLTIPKPIGSTEKHTVNSFI